MIIYKTTNKINGKFYIGQDTKNNSSYLGSGKLILAAIVKYGKENFIKEIIETCDTQERLDEKEIFWIKELNAIDRETGYNLHTGGKGMTAERRQNIGKGLKGRIFSEEHKQKIASKTKAFHTGRKRSDETIKKMSDARKNLTEEQKNRISKAMSKSRKGIPMSEEAKRKISESLKGRKYKSHRIK